MVLFTLLEKANSLVLILYKIMKKLWKAFDQKKQRNKAVVESEQGNHLWVFFFFFNLVAWGLSCGRWAP